jgi:4-hydroxy-tetrahydrodipicolinate synthase
MSRADSVDDVSTPLDEEALKRLVESQVAGGVQGIVPVGTTGESPTLDFDEHVRVIRLSHQFANGRVKVLAGTGSNSTREAIELTQEAEKIGVDGSLQVAPYYNRPTQEGLYRHFKTVASHTRLPILLYSVPGRCGVEIGVETARRLALDCPNIVGIKEAGGSADRVTQLRAACGPQFQIISGDDALTLPFMALGATGVISVASNVVPFEVCQLVEAAAAGDTAAAQQWHYRLLPLFRALFLESNPAPCKAATHMRGITAPDVRLPLVPVTPATHEALRLALVGLGVLS